MKNIIYLQKTLKKSGCNYYNDIKKFIFILERQEELQ
jgi:hypothetical protein